MNATQSTARPRAFVPGQLVDGIVNLSEATTWNRAKREWHLHTIWFARGGRCICGHYPIVEHCEIVNALNGNLTVVGNHCVRQFLAIESDRMFRSLRRVIDNNGAALNRDVIEFAYRRRWITRWEKDFYIDTLRKRRLSQRQLGKRMQINAAVLIQVGVDDD